MNKSQLPPGSVRIIGGQWRGRKLTIPNTPGLRPTPNRVRETLFNWLAPIIEGAYCLDLFAGSGVLGFEALSRGASHVVMVDKALPVIKQLQANTIMLGTTAITIYQQAIPASLFILPYQFDVVFLDPPFHEGLIKSSCEWLEQQGCLHGNAYIYIEAESSLTPLPIPNHWQILRSKTAGQVGYHLIQRQHELS